MIRRDYFTYAEGTTLIQPRGTPTTNHATTRFKLAVVTNISFNERLAIANISHRYCLLFAIDQHLCQTPGMVAERGSKSGVAGRKNFLLDDQTSALRSKGFVKIILKYNSIKSRRFW